MTTRPANEVMKCIRDKWREHLNPVLEEKSNEGWMLRHNDVLPAATVAIVTISDIGSETEVNYYHRTNRIKIHRLEEEVIGCRQ